MSLEILRVRQLGDNPGGRRHLLHHGLVKEVSDFLERHRSAGFIARRHKTVQAVFDYVVFVDQRGAHVKEDPLDAGSFRSVLLGIAVGFEWTPCALKRSPATGRSCVVIVHSGVLRLPMKLSVIVPPSTKRRTCPRRWIRSSRPRRTCGLARMPAWTSSSSTTTATMGPLLLRVAWARRSSMRRSRVWRGPATPARASAEGTLLVFVDADVIVPPELLYEIHAAMGDPACVGGAVDVEYRPKRLSMRLYLHVWRLLARLTRMTQGATQFCRRDVFEEVGGYDEGAWIGRTWTSTGVSGNSPGKERHGPLPASHAGPAVLPPLRQVAGLEDPGLDKPPLHRTIPPPGRRLGRLVLASGEVGRKALH